jgi:hypothetical protein
VDTGVAFAGKADSPLQRGMKQAGPAEGKRGRIVVQILKGVEKISPFVLWGCVRSKDLGFTCLTLLVIGMLPAAPLERFAVNVVSPFIRVEFWFVL